MRIEAEKPRLAQQPYGYLYIEGVSWLLRDFLITAPAQFKELEDAFLKLLAKISQLSAD